MNFAIATARARRDGVNPSLSLEIAAFLQKDGRRRPLRLALRHRDRWQRSGRRALGCVRPASRSGGRGAHPAVGGGGDRRRHRHSYAAGARHFLVWNVPSQALGAGGPPPQPVHSRLPVGRRVRDRPVQLLAVPRQRSPARPGGWTADAPGHRHPRVQRGRVAGGDRHFSGHVRVHQRLRRLASRPEPRRSRAARPTSISSGTAFTRPKRRMR